MKISHEFEYNALPVEIAREFCDKDSKEQATTINYIGEAFDEWAHDPKKTATHIQMLDIAEQLNDKGRWFIETLCEYMRGE